MVDWFWFYNPCFEYLAGYAKPKEANAKWAMHFSGNKMHSHVEVVGICSLVLSSGFILNLEKAFYIPSFSRSLISVSRVVPLGYSFSFYETSFSLFYKSNLVGNGTLSNGLFSINLQNDTTNNTMHVHIGTKQCVMNEDFSMLWHLRLRHISI